MCDTAARLVDRVLPDVRLRQWVLSVPFELRLVLAKNPEALNACGRIFVEEIFRWQRLVGIRRGFVPAQDAKHLLRGGAVSFPQRFGGSLNLNVHYHVVVPDAVFFRDTDGVVQHELLQAPSKADLHDITHNVSIRVIRLMTRRGMIAPDDGDSVQSEPTTLEACLSSSLGLGDLAALKQDKIKKIDTHSRESVSKRARGGEFNIHAGVTATAKDDRERLVRYCARAPLSLERLSVSRCGKVVYQLRHPIRGKTHRVMEPYQFLARLCALIPPPRHPLVRFHGVLAPNSGWRKAVVPVSAEVKLESDTEGIAVEKTANKSVERDWNAQRLDWATLLKRVHNVDALACLCGGRLSFIELIEDRKEATAQLIARGLPVYLPPKLKAQAAPDHDYVDTIPEDDWDDWDQSPQADASTPDPAWDDP
jgi:hypothetical protein